MANDAPVYGRRDALSAGVLGDEVLGDPLRGGAQAAEVRGAADVQLVGGELVRAARVQVAALDDRAQQLLVGGVAERVRDGVLDLRADRAGALVRRRAARQRARG